MMENHQRRVQIALPALRKYFARVRSIVGLPENAATIWFVEDAQMARWNRTYRGKRGTTDVLSFPSSANGDSHGRRRTQTPRQTTNDSSDGYLGDIAISPVVARRNARRFGRTLRDELRILVLHGLLHLMGYDHETDNGEMTRVENRLRVKLGLS
jgi:probable rRNA maturation factor